MHDLERLEAISYTGMAELEETIRRVVAIRTWGVTNAAGRIGVRHSSLSQWARAKGRNIIT